MASATHSAILAGALLCAASCSALPSASMPSTAPSQPTSIPFGWQEANVSGAFRMTMPSDMKEKKVQGVDSVVNAFESKSIRISSDYGSFSDPLDHDADKPKYQKSNVTVGGKAATLVAYEDPGSERGKQFVAAIHFPKVTGDGKIRLTVYAFCADEKAQQMAKRMFQTIKFPEP